MNDTLTTGTYRATDAFRAITDHACVCREGDDTLVATVGPAGEPESERLARLFAAAPNLLEALTWLYEMAGYAVRHLEPEWAAKGGGGDTNRSNLQDALSVARAALAQARGEEGSAK